MEDFNRKKPQNNPNPIDIGSVDIMVNAEVKQVKKALAEVSASESRYRTLIEHSNEAITVVSGSKIVYINEVAAGLCGYLPKEMIGTDALRFIPDGYREEFRERIFSRLRGEPQPLRFDHGLLRKDGSVIDIETTASLIDYGGIPAALFVGRDLTERKRFEAKLFALHEHAAQLGSSETLVEVSDAVLGAVTSVMKFSRANFLLNEGYCYRCIYSTSPGDSFWEIPIDGEGIVPYCAREKRTIMRHNQSGYDSLKKAVVRSELATPVLLQKETEAVISLESADSDVFSDNDARILEIIAKHAAIAIERIGHLR